MAHKKGQGSFPKRPRFAVAAPRRQAPRRRGRARGQHPRSPGRHRDSSRLQRRDGTRLHAVRADRRQGEVPALRPAYNRQHRSRRRLAGATSDVRVGRLRWTFTHALRRRSDDPREGRRRRQGRDRVPPREVRPQGRAVGRRRRRRRVGRAGRRRGAVDAAGLPLPARVRRAVRRFGAEQGPVWPRRRGRGVARPARDAGVRRRDR